MLRHYRNMLTQFAKPGALVAVVSDSYDLWNAIDNLWGDRLKQDVIRCQGVPKSIHRSHSTQIASSTRSKTNQRPQVARSHP